MSADFDKFERTAKISYISKREQGNPTIHFIYTTEVFLDSDDLEKSLVVESRLYDATIYFIRLYRDGYLIYVPYQSSPVQSDAYLLVLSIINFIKNRHEMKNSILAIDDIYDIASFLVHINGKDDLNPSKNDMNALIKDIELSGFRSYYFFGSSNYSSVEKEVVGKVRVIEDW